MQRRMMREQHQKEQDPLMTGGTNTNGGAGAGTNAPAAAAGRAGSVGSSYGYALPPPPPPPPPRSPRSPPALKVGPSGSPPQLHHRHATGGGGGRDRDGIGGTLRGSARGSPSAAGAGVGTFPSAYDYNLSSPSRSGGGGGGGKSYPSSPPMSSSPTHLGQRSRSWTYEAEELERESEKALIRTPVYFLLPSVLFLFFLVDSHLPFQVAMLSFLILYGMDLANVSRSLFLYAMVLSVIMLGVVQGYACFLEPQQPIAATPVQAMLAVWVWTAVAAALTLSSVPWLTLSPNSSNASGGYHQRGAGQQQQQEQQRRWTGTAMRLQSLLYGLVPPIFAGLSTSAVLTTDDIEENADDFKAVIAPHLFAVFMSIAMLAMARTAMRGSSYNYNEDSETTFTPIITKQISRLHVALLILTPPAMHVVSCWGRIIGTTTLDDVYNLILASTIPVLLYQAVYALQFVNTGGDNYHAKATMPYRKLVPNFIVCVLTLAASVALQQRYLISMSHSFAYRFFGTRPNVLLSTIYWFASTTCFLISIALWGRTTIDAEGNIQPFFGEYQEDGVQLGLALAGMCFGKAFGLPWNFVPLPVLACLGLVLWMTTRLLRYLAIFLFVGHATGIVVFTYRFAGIDETISVVHLVKLSLMQFAFVVVVSSVLVGLIAGLSIRSTGGIGAKFLRKLDVTGLLLIMYSVLLIALEVTLLKKSEMPMEEELMSVSSADASSTNASSTLYHPSLAMLTSLLLAGLASFLKRVNVISGRSAATVTALSIGKAVSIYIDAAEEGGGGTNGSGDNASDASAFSVFIRALVAALLTLVMFAPRVFLEPVHVKTFSRRASKTSGRRGSEIPEGTMRAAGLYAFVFLPIALLVSIPYVLIPLAGVFSDKFQDDNYYYYTSAAIRSGASSFRLWHLPELIGCLLALWGLACVSMLNYYLPDAGGEAYKKLSALAFLVGTGIFFAAPVLGVSSSSASAAARNPYAAMSSLGTQLIQRRRSRTGGWGLLAAAIATLLAISGPLELKERTPTATGGSGSGGHHRDKLLLLRTMIFSLLFGGGVAWFIVMSTMREADFIELIVVTIACLIVASMATVSAVLSYFLTLEEFDDAVQVTRVWFVVLVIFLPFAWSSRMFVSQSMHLFGTGGWLSTYLAVSCLAAFSIAMSLRMRSTKNASTSSLGNLLCVFSWFCAVALIYGRYGVAGLDSNYDVRTMFWIPVTIVGTILVSPILLALEGETSSRRQSAVRKLATSSQRSGGGGGGGIFGFRLANLRQSNRWAPLFFCTVYVFIMASLYAILLRGCGIFSPSAPASTTTIPQTQGDDDDNLDYPDLATLAAKAVSQSQALKASAKLAGSGIWTAKNIFVPLVHLGGVVATLPSLYLLLRRSWYNRVIPTAQVTLALPLNAIPLILCRGLPSLQAAAIMSLVGGLIQMMALRKADQESMMRI